MRIERLTRAYLEHTDVFANNKVYYQAWLKYAERVEDREDVYEFMMAKEIGSQYCRTFKTVAAYFE